MKDYGMFICEVCNEIGHASRGVLVPSQLNKDQKVMVHKRCEASAYKMFIGGK